MASVHQFDPAAEVYLFGSRTDDSKRGGDIDILIRSDLLARGRVEDIREEIFRHLEEQKIDLVLTGKSAMSAFAKMILAKGAIRLCQKTN
ncbi:hypothetical protein GMSM_26030 [Geomonas sp. Red276]